MFSEVINNKYYIDKLIVSFYSLMYTGVGLIYKYLTVATVLCNYILWFLLVRDKVLILRQ